MALSASHVRLLDAALDAVDEAHWFYRRVFRSSDGTAADCHQDNRHQLIEMIRDLSVCLCELYFRLTAAEPCEEPIAAENFDLHRVRRVVEIFDTSNAVENRPGELQGTNAAHAIEELVQIRAVFVRALTGSTIQDVLQALSRQGQGSASLEPHEQGLVLATMLWLRKLRPGEISAAQLCEGIAVSMAKGVTSLADVRPVTEADMLRVCGGLVQRTDDGAGIQLVCPQVRDFGSLDTIATRCMIAIACLRMLNFSEFGKAVAEYRVELKRSADRVVAHPFYSYALETWMEVTPDDGDDPALAEELTDEACRFFRSDGNLTSWLVGFGGRRLAAVYGLSPLHAHLKVAALCAKRRPAPEHVAACLGLGYVCIALVARDAGADVAKPEKVGALLHCALTGPPILLPDVLKFDWELARKPFQLSSRLDTATMLFDSLGTQGAVARRTVDVSPSFIAVALMAFAARSGLGDARAFLTLCPVECLDDDDFLDTLSDKSFPYPASESAQNGCCWIEPRKQFLQDLCSDILDQTWDRIMLVWHTVWWKAALWSLPCSRPTTRWRLSVADEVFVAMSLRAMQQHYPPVVAYLLQDPRWNSNLPLDNVAEEDRGRTLMHLAVEVGPTETVKLLLDHGGADVTVADASGRTPLHICESHEVAELLHAAGADLRQPDNDGRLLWHYVAANNDYDMLPTLRKLDPDKKWVLTQKTKQGRTPLAEAFAFVRFLIGEDNGYDKYTDLVEVNTFAIMFFLDWLNTRRTGKLGPEYLCSDIPVLCLAAEWGFTMLVPPLREMFTELRLVTEDGSGPLHFLNFAASAELIAELRKVPGVAELPLLDNNHHSPAETIFLTFMPSLPEYYTCNGHPSNNCELDPAAYAELLTEEVCQSRDSAGRTLWQRFCEDIILRYARAWQSSALEEALNMAVGQLVERGVVRAYEAETGLCAFQELSDLIFRLTRLECIPWWLAKVYLSLLEPTANPQRLDQATFIYLSYSEAGRHHAEIQNHNRVVAELAKLGVSRDKIVTRDTEGI
jgi:hypothetical protein